MKITSWSKSSRGLAQEGRLGPLDVLAVSVWCGLAAGWLEVVSRVLSRKLNVTGQLYMISRHFVWLVPLSNLLLFFGAGLFLAVATKIWPGPGGWLSRRMLWAVTILPALMVASAQVYAWAWLILAWGIAVRLVPWLDRPPVRLRRWLMTSFPVLLGSVFVVAGFVFGSDWLKQRREAARSLPPAETPNVLLIVLDTVRADHLSLYGHPRATSPTLERLAKGGIRFDEARATAPWTLASHASMFTGRWPHELDVRWVTPLAANFPTLAQYLGYHGYATAGFVANTEYCSSETGLDRGFTHYEDYPPDLEHLRPFRTAVLVQRAWDAASNLGMMLNQSLPVGRFHAWFKWLVDTDRKDAGSINRDFVDWLLHRPEPRRPFFAFLNYFDAHSPYLPPDGTAFRFGLRPQTMGDLILLTELWATTDKLKLAPHYHQLLRDSYDNCLAYLDQHLGELFDSLERRGVLDRTVVIVTADHGEELGEHGLFEHGESLYRPEIRVPLVFILPSQSRSRVVVKQTVSLRDLPATIVDLAGLAAGAPFPGRSLATLWRDSPPEASADPGDFDGAISELTAPNPTDPSRGRSPAARGPLIALAEGDYVYIRNERDGREQLFHERADPDERVNLVKIESMQPRLERLRARLLGRMKAIPPQAARP